MEVNVTGTTEDAAFEPIVRALAMKARGETVTEEVEDEVYEATMFLVAAQLVRSGIAASKVARMIDEQEPEIRLGYDPAIGELSITVRFADGRQGNGHQGGGMSSE